MARGSELLMITEMGDEFRKTSRFPASRIFVIFSKPRANIASAAAITAARLYLSELGDQGQQRFAREPGVEVRLAKVPHRLARFVGCTANMG